MATITVKAASGLLVRDPVTKKEIPANGASVSSDSPYWQRRLRDGDVVIVTDSTSYSGIGTETKSAS